MVGQNIPRKLKTDQSRNEVGVKRARDKILSRDELIKLSAQDRGQAVILKFSIVLYSILQTVYIQVLDSKHSNCQVV